MFKSTDKGREPIAPFMSSETRVCNLKPFQQYGSLDNNKDYAKTASQKKTPLIPKYKSSKERLNTRMLSLLNSESRPNKSLLTSQELLKVADRGGEKDPAAAGTKIPKLTFEGLAPPATPAN